VDLAKPEGFAAALDAADAALVASTPWSSPRPSSLSKNAGGGIELCRKLSPMTTRTLVFCEHARKQLLAPVAVTWVVFSSVAGERGRKPVAIYGSAKLDCPFT